MAGVINRLRRRGSRQREPPVRASDSRWSVVSSAVDLLPRPTDRLLGILLDAATNARENELTDLAVRGTDEQSAWTRLWPGEHYRLLAGLVQSMQPRTVVEIGTFQGFGALALLDRLPADATLTTFDLISWQDMPGCVLTDADFADGRLNQRLGDLSDPSAFAEHHDLLARSDLVFMDAPKDGRFEPAFLDLAVPVWRGSERILVIDDTRLMPMVQLWRDIPFPKVDATSFGHWSGTGLVITA